MKFRFGFIFILALALTQLACEDNSIKAERQEIKEYLSEQGKLDQAIETDEGIFIILNEEGIGDEHPDISSTVNVKYTGYLMENGNIFDTSDNATRQFQLSQMISGWRIGIPYMKEAGHAELYIPSAHGYGEFDHITSGGTIPGGSVLVFDVELVNFF